MALMGVIAEYGTISGTATGVASLDFIEQETGGGDLITQENGDGILQE